MKSKRDYSRVMHKQVFRLSLIFVFLCVVFPLIVVALASTPSVPANEGYKALVGIILVATGGALLYLLWMIIKMGFALPSETLLDKFERIKKDALVGWMVRQVGSKVQAEMSEWELRKEGEEIFRVAVERMRWRPLMKFLEFGSLLFLVLALFSNLLLEYSLFAGIHPYSCIRTPLSSLHVIWYYFVATALDTLSPGYCGCVSPLDTTIELMEAALGVFLLAAVLSFLLSLVLDEMKDIRESIVLYLGLLQRRREI